MDKLNAHTSQNINPNNGQNTSIPPITITEGTTLGELIAMLHLGEKPNEAPTPKMLRETAGDPIAMDDRCLVYANGYAVYDNGSGRTVVWLPDCLSFTYYFNPMKDSEIGGEIKQTCELPDGLLASEPWPIGVTLIGDHRVENNVMQRQGDRKKNKSLIRGDNEEGEALDEMEEREDSLAKAYSWNEGRFGEDPLEYVLREERRREMLGAMTPKQREVFILYYQEGCTQQEIADILRIARTSVMHRLESALKKVKKIST